MLEMVKESLRITWDYDDKHLQSLIDRAEANINALAGAELNYKNKGLAQTLLLNYVRYDYNNAIEYFEENFAKEILRLQLEVAAEEGWGRDDTR